jgi:hypothetical protein
MSHTPSADHSYSGIHQRLDGSTFEVWRHHSNKQWYWSNCETDEEGFVVTHLGADNGPFETSYEAYRDA